MKGKPMKILVAGATLGIAGLSLAVFSLLSLSVVLYVVSIIICFASGWVIGTALDYLTG
jgi:hypothetical protein